MIEAVLIFLSPFRPGPLNLQLVCVSIIQWCIATGIHNEKTCFNPFSCKDEIAKSVLNTYKLLYMEMYVTLLIHCVKMF